jgi:D-alanyl-D-alanine carboxypeptidase/D-alanyl-D-alanine-endopeptidase (penicillin-binding protein 4)
MRRTCVASLVLILLITQIVFSKGIDFRGNLWELIPKEARSNGKLGVVVRSLKSDETIFEYNADGLFVPASNVKIITSVTALSLLKADYRFKTEFYSGGEILNGVLYGGLYIKGYGDPTLKTEHLNSIAYEFKKRGIKEIKGGITVDDSYFDKARYGKGWKEKWKGDVFSPPISALSLNYNTFDINIHPSKLGRAPVVGLEPKGTNVNIINKAITRKGKNTLVAHWLEEGKTIILKGGISPHASFFKIQLTVENPALYTGSVFKKILEESGIKVQGFITMGEVPSWAEIFYTHFSPPLHVIITEYNKNSVNIIGENIVKTLGAEIKGTPGTWEKGSQVVSEFLRKIGIKDGFTIVDGSGLSPLNQVSPKTLTEILKYAYKDRLISIEFISSLPIGGVDGTLKKRFRMSKVEGRVLAKTGHLDNVSALSGYLFTENGDVLVFSILANGLGWKATEFQNNLLMRLLECCRNNQSSTSFKNFR